MSNGPSAVPPWLTGPPVAVSGSVLSHSGVVLPVLDPGQAVVLHLTAT